ncbi:hypothetical protein HKBW3S09_00101 [Candidatus Hakubella thermalkaliphila]|uniref:PIN domain-containing protein n=1 Tax=Candidatus Hakubella thermalkaliphila TaxID=2754717 RepID=A0A6V8Q7N7_9ACTN|nr:hypothetical protein [Actinomycetota bacterium]GFP22633.1 hypothetical protein HKBW3S09_00101 [Candidatus Hakubella thermalkaliphila]GFP40114.1 hypothetical protein HKBW3S47_01812 [Candidatus Hakubella thermalkaliphila]
MSIKLLTIDALHIAMAEQSDVDYFVTCDDAIIKKGKSLHDSLKVKVLGILDFLTEVLHVKDIEGN